LLHISSDNDNVDEILNGLMSFGILDPQESRKRTLALAFNTSSNSDVIPLNVEFSSRGVVYWSQDLLINLTGVEDLEQLPTEYSLTQNYPNPFNPSTTIKYSLPRDEKRKTKNVKLVVFDLLGREVVTLVNKKQKAGHYQVKWEAANIPSGVYFYKLTAGDYVNTKKMLLIK
jgi:hypothetical protein